jgi:hypothetical protein
MVKKSLIVQKGRTDVAPGTITKLQKRAAALRKKRMAALEAAAKIDRLALFDGSGSMGETDAIGLDGLPCSRWIALLQAWYKLAPQCEGRLAAYVFSSGVHPVQGSASGDVVTLPYPGGDTPMCAAFESVAIHRHPRLRALLVSDGLSTDGDPVGNAVALGCPVDTVYVGPSTGPDALKGRDQLRRIAAATGGSFKNMAGQFDAAKFLEHCEKVLQLES